MPKCPVDMMGCGKELENVPHFCTLEEAGWGDIKTDPKTVVEFRWCMECASAWHELEWEEDD